MPAKRPRIPLLVRFRTLLLVAVVIFVAGLIVLYRLGSSGPAPAAAPPAPSALGLPEDGVTSVSRDFDYSQFEGDRPLFRVRGERYSVDRANVAHLEGVDLTLYREEGDFQVTSRKALYRQDEQSAELEEEVHLQGPEDFELWTDKLVVSPGGSRVVSPEPSRFAYSRRLEGSARYLRVEVPSQLYLLQGDVVLTAAADPETGRDPARLVAERAYLEQAERLLRAEGDIVLTYGANRLETRRMTVHLAADADVARFVRAQWGVSGTLEPPEGGAAVNYAADELAALFTDEGDLLKVGLEGGPQQAAQLETRDPVVNVVRTLLANHVEGDFAEDRLGLVEAFGQVRITERPAQPADAAPLRQAWSERARGRFGPEGSLAAVTLLGGVDYQEADVHLRGERAELAFAAGTAEFLGEPARLESVRGNLTAHRLRYERATQKVEARQEVRAALRQDTASAAMPSALMGSGEGPVWVEAEEADWLRGQGSIVFRGKVRAWRGRNLLLARTLTVSEGGRSLEAEGDVKTVWHPARPVTPVPTPAGAEAAAPGAQALEVDAGSFVYDGAKGRLRYATDVRVVDGPRVMRCDEAVIELDEQETMKKLTCTGNARLEDRASGQNVEAQRAIYDTVAGQVEFEGDPVRMRDRRGGKLEGRRVLYDLATGAASASAKPEATPKNPATP